MKISAVFIMVLIMFFALPVCTLSAEEDFSSETERINEILDEGSGGLVFENNIGVDNAENLIKSDIKGFFRWMSEKIYSEISAPFRLFIILFSVVLLSSLSSGMYLSGGKICGQNTAQMISVLVSVSVISETAGKSIDEACRLISDGSMFMLSFVPVMSGVMAAQGNVTSAAGYQLLTAGICEIFAQISSAFFVPFLSLCFSISIVDAVNPGLSLDGIIKGIKKAVTILLGLTMTIFSGLLALRNTVGAAADSLTVKTGKYLVSNLVPVVGKAVSDAYSSVRGSIGVLRTGVGSTGIAVIIVMAAAPVIRLLLYMFVMESAGVISDIFGCQRLKKLFSDISVIYGLMLGTVTVFLVLLVTSAAVVMRSYTGE